MAIDTLINLLGWQPSKFGIEAEKKQNQGPSTVNFYPLLSFIVNEFCLSSLATEKTREANSPQRSSSGPSMTEVAGSAWMVGEPGGTMFSWSDCGDQSSTKRDRKSVV